MSSLPITTPSHGLFRGTVLVFAFVLGCQAMWILAAEFSPRSLTDFHATAETATAAAANRDVAALAASLWIMATEFSHLSLSGFPATAEAATAAAANRNVAALAASFGFIRGDLWAEYALTYLSLSWGDERDSASTQTSPTIVEQAHDVADRALAFAPHDARIWLVLASIDSRFDWLNHKAAAALRMSYYTGANETDLIPLRLLLAIHSDALADKDFQQLVRHDIRTIVIHKPELKPAILATYRGALPIGQQFIEETLEEVDPTLLTKIRLRQWH